MRVGRWTLGLATLVLAGSCAEPAPPPVRSASVPARVVPAAPPPAPPVAAPPVFRYAGVRMQGGLLIGTAPEGAAGVTVDGVPVPLAENGRFLVGLDRDHGPIAALAATTAAGQVVRDTVAVAPRAWDISHLASLRKYPVPPARFAELRPIELQQIAAARAMHTDAQGWRQRFQWPATGRISTLFGSQRIYRDGEQGSYHSGIDIARPTGTPVLAPADGVVTLATDRPFTLEGNLLMLDHGMGLSSAFMHLSRLHVAAGEHVRQGEVIGEVGATGRATGPHLHWGLRWQEARIDPLLVAGPMPSAQ
ncbi:M23 family metallopeptidase [Sphingomonas aracearum]|uniref:M23 family peptidase n=1 Tax=Sphingomonas aracearum TaxID=2283317 RepID=A0A369VR98_9SPHN|nr:M23 family metallopeptidase [Sphingomonas aracearum]RDE04904.1 M23 family peptidase [Sphingomonas aracearum]